MLRLCIGMYFGLVTEMEIDMRGPVYRINSIANSISLPCNASHAVVYHIFIFSCRSGLVQQRRKPRHMNTKDIHAAEAWLRVEMIGGQTQTIHAIAICLSISLLCLLRIYMSKLPPSLELSQDFTLLAHLHFIVDHLPAPLVHPSIPNRTTYTHLLTDIRQLSALSPPLR